MRYRSTVVLFVLFLAGLGALWWAEYAGVPDRDKQRELLNRLLPELIDTDLAEVRRVEVLPGPGAKSDRPPIVVERRGRGAWQLKQPVDAAAETNLVETLVRNLKDLRKSYDAGTIHGDPAPYGLDRPEAVVKVFGAGSAGEPLATLDVGKVDRKRLYVRPGGSAGIEVVDAVLLEPITLPPVRWRDTALFHVPSFRVAEVDVKEVKPEPREIALKRDERHWRLVRPIQVPADDDKAEGLVAELSALRVDGADGFVKDDAGQDDLARFGLDRPSMTLTLTPFRDGGPAQELKLGAAVEGKPDLVYAVRGDQDDVVRLDVKRLREAIPGVNGLRSQKALDFTPQRVSRVRIEAHGKLFDLARTRRGWALLSPVRESADSASVQSLLMRLAEARTSEFLDPKNVPNAKLDPPAFRVKGWQAEPGTPPFSESPSPDEPRGEPRFDLSLGRHDAVKKTIYGRVKGDDATVLALPGSIAGELPAGEFAYRDRTILDVKPTQFARVTVERGGTAATVVPGGPKDPPNTWKMVEPVEARADLEGVTAMLTTLGNLRAESWVSDKVGDGKAYGLDRPALRVKWALNSGQTSEANREGTLRVSAPRGNVAKVFGNVEGDPRVFTLNAGLLAAFETELHDRRVIAFKPESAESVVLGWPTRTIALNRYRPPGTNRSEWHPALGSDATGLDLSRAEALVSAFSDLKATRFQQYDGPIPAAAGLSPPSFSVRVQLTGDPNPRVLRIGNPAGPDAYLATNAGGDTGPVFVLPASPAWKGLLKPPPHPDDLPDDVFAPLPAKAGAG